MCFHFSADRADLGCSFHSDPEHQALSARGITCGFQRERMCAFGFQIVATPRRLLDRAEPALVGDQRGFGVRSAGAHHRRAFHLDAPLVFGALPRKAARYLAAGAAADYFFEVRWRKTLTTLFFNAFAVERNAEGKRASQSQRLLEAGIPILLFPEGGRARAGEFRPYKPGPFALALGTDCPVVPLALVGASSAMPRGVNWPLKGRMPVTVVIGEPMRGEPDEKPREFSDRVAAKVRELHESIAPVPPHPAGTNTESPA